MSFQVFDNENIALGGGAGIQSAQFVASKGAGVVITDNCGPNAVQTLTAAGVEVIVGQSGTVKQVIQDYKDGKLQGTTKANVSDHYGMGGGMGRGMGGGMGRGMGGGMGRGSGGGMGRGSGGYGQGAAPGGRGPAGSREQELQGLKDQANSLREQIEAIESRIRDLE
jgi:predicted Fe-Mo cluster-binding NifX family protein